MRITKHAKRRMRQRGIRTDIVDFIEYFVPSNYLQGANKITLSKRKVNEITRDIRKFIDQLEKHSGTELVLDTGGRTLITAYRKHSKKFNQLTGKDNVGAGENKYGWELD